MDGTVYTVMMNWDGRLIVLGMTTDIDRAIEICRQFQEPRSEERWPSPDQIFVQVMTFSKGVITNVQDGILTTI